MKHGDGERPDSDARSDDGRLLSPTRVGHLNRASIIQALCEHGPLARADLARVASVPRATISNIVQRLIDEGFLEEGPPEATGQVGKPARPLRFSPSAGLSGAIALSGGRYEAGLVNARGDLLEHDVGGLDASDPTGEGTVQALVEALERVLRGTDDVLGIGVAVPGVCDASGVVRRSWQFPGLEGVRLSERLSQALDQPVHMDNDSRAQALGERWFGAGRRHRTFASIQTGHGLSVGLVINGVLYRGISGGAGELGHIPVAAAGEQCRCGLHGCWETIATLSWLRGEALRRGLSEPTHLDTRELLDQAEASEAAHQLLEDYVANLAVGLSALIQVLDPGVLVVHGDVIGGGEAFRARLEEETRARILPNGREGVAIVFSQLDQLAGLLGAAGLVLSDAFELTI